MFDLVPVVSVRGEVVTSNISDIKEVALAWIATINTSLKSDEDFSEATNDIKACKDAETKLEKAKSDIVAQMAQVDAVLTTVDEIKGELARTRLFLTKLVKDREQEIKDTALNDVRDQWIAKVEQVNNRLGFMKITGVFPDFHGVVKGCKTLKSYKERLNKELSQSYEIIESLAESFISKRDYVLEHQGEYGFLFSDMSDLVKLNQEELESVIAARIQKYEAVTRDRNTENNVSTKPVASVNTHQNVSHPLIEPSASEKNVQPTVGTTEQAICADSNGVFIPRNLIGTLKYIIKLTSPVLGKNDDFQQLVKLVS
jgi:hypothetical protein